MQNIGQLVAFRQERVCPNKTVKEYKYTEESELDRKRKSKVEQFDTKKKATCHKLT